MKLRLVLPMLCLAALSGFAEETFYRSNITGMLLEKIPPYRRDSSEWVVTIDRAPGRETRRLLDNGRETRRWETSWSEDRSRREEKETTGAQLASRRVYDAAGNLLQEDEYADGAVTRTSVLTYSAGRVRRTQVRGPHGEQLSVTDYVYATNGSLREVVHTEAGGAEQVSSAVAGPSGISEQVVATGVTRQVIRYDADGRIIEKERRTSDAVVSREQFRYRPDSDFLESSTEELPAEGGTIERRYDEAGKIVSEVSTARGGAVEEVLFTRNDKGRLVAKSRRAAAGLEVWRYLLADDGSVAREEYSLRGSLQKVTTYGKGKERTEDFYRDGAIFLRVYFDGDTRLREEVYSGDTVLRERTFE
jgi:hypothetical protein